MSKGDNLMEKETSSLVSLGIVLIAIAVVITLGFGIFAVGKRLANNGQNDLVNQVGQISDSTFTDLDQQVITGTRLKGVINQLSTGNYAVLLNTLALRNAQGDAAKLNGALVKNNALTSPDVDKDKNEEGWPIIWTNLGTKTSKGKSISCTAFVNYNAILKNAMDVTFYDSTSGLGTAAAGTTTQKTLNTVEWKKKDEKSEITFIGTEGTVNPASDNVSTAAGLKMEQGVFQTELDFITNPDTGNIVKNIITSDFNRQGTTMYIADAAQYNSYCIKDSTNNYVGLAFCEILK